MMRRGRRANREKFSSRNITIIITTIIIANGDTTTTTTIGVVTTTTITITISGGARADHPALEAPHFD